MRTPEGRRSERRYDVDGRLRFEEVGSRVARRLIKDGEFVEISVDERGLRTRIELDANRNPIRITKRQTEDGAFSYGYDPLDRLTQAIPPPNLQRNPAAPEEGKLPIEAYSYDPVHNRLSSQHQPGAWQYNQDNQLLGYGVGSEQITLSYSTNGHTTREVTGNPAAPLKVRDYRYNAAERLTEIDDNGQAIGRYRYDPMGRRVYKETVTETTWFIYADEGLIAELQADGTLKRGYGWKPQGLWGTDPLWLADKTGSGQSDWSTHIYHNDHLWTPQRLTDSAGVVSWSGRSEAFELTTAVVDSVENPLRFPVQIADEESGSSHNFLRDYSSIAAAYIQVDPIGLDGGANIYAYVRQNPLGGIDPTGEVAVGHALAAALMACARNRICRCMAIYGAYKPAFNGLGCARDVVKCCDRPNCAYLALKTASVFTCMSLRYMYMKQGCDRVIPTRANHPKAAAEASSKWRDCQAKLFQCLWC